MAPPEPTDYQRLIAPSLGRLFRTAYRLTGSVPDAEDLVQDTCLAAGEHLPSLLAAEHPERWLLRVLHNRFVDGARRKKASPVVSVNGSVDTHIADQSEATLANDALATTDVAEQTAEERAFRSACARLSDSHRALLSLRAEGYGLVEIETITGISRDVLRARLQRARSSLARHLAEESGSDGRRPRRRIRP